jgi:hypothetical protein
VEVNPSAPADGWPAYGAYATLRLPDGTTHIGQVDGGSGHTGAPSPEIQSGLGKVPADATIAVNLTWRDATGKVRRDEFSLKPGWHTIRLASGAQAAVLKTPTTRAGGSRNQAADSFHVAAAL